MILCVCPNPSVDSYAWLDQLNPGEVNRIIEQKEFPGGKGIHVALALNEINEPSCVLGFWAGATGRWIREKCSDRSIPCYGPRVEGSNRKCYTFMPVTNSSAVNNTELLEPGPAIKPGDYKLFVEDFERISRTSGLVCLSGSWPPGVVETAYRDLIVIARQNNKRIILDASGPQLEQALKAQPYAIHLNLKEAKSLYQTGDVKSILNSLSDHVELIALTSGNEGLYLTYRGNIIHACINIEQVFSAVGSGDCLTAGIAYAIHHNMSLTDIAKWGVACGTANCLREDLGMLYKGDVNDLMGQINIKEPVL